MPSGGNDFETARLGVFAAPGSPLAHVQLRNSGSWNRKALLGVEIVAASVVAETGMQVDRILVITYAAVECCRALAEK